MKKHTQKKAIAEPTRFANESVIIVRHGEYNDNEPFNLTVKGHGQILELAWALVKAGHLSRENKKTLILSSKRKRAKETADKIAGHLNFEYEVEDALTQEEGFDAERIVRMLKKYPVPDILVLVGHLPLGGFAETITADWPTELRIQEVEPAMAEAYVFHLKSQTVTNATGELSHAA